MSSWCFLKKANLSGQITEARDKFVCLFDSPNHFQKQPDNSNVSANLEYTRSDEWSDPTSCAMGISDYAQSQPSDIVFVELLVEEGDTLEARIAIASVELVIASAEIYPAASAKVSPLNKDLSNKLETLNLYHYGEGCVNLPNLVPVISRQI
jgi:glycine cleavage system H protein